MSPLRASKYIDAEKLRETRNAQRKRYYGKTALYITRPWTEDETELVMEHGIPDTELSDLIERSVQAIQLRRMRGRREEGISE